MALYCDQEPTVGSTVALLHGFTQNSRCWGSFRPLLQDKLGASSGTVAVDLPGHGKSHHDEADLDQAARLVTDAIGPATYVGYSMGGRIALHAALADPGAVEHLVLIGATGGLARSEERAERRMLDEDRARRLEQIGLAAFLDEWLALPLFAGIASHAHHREDRMANRLEGLAASLRSCGTGTQRPLWPELHRLDMPVTVIAGEYDSKFLAAAQRLVAAIGDNARAVTIQGSGHTCHLEQPELTAAAVYDAMAGVRK